jgi:hypothetical protein
MTSRQKRFQKGYEAGYLQKKLPSQDDAVYLGYRIGQQEHAAGLPQRYFTRADPIRNKETSS